ncbi:hypothetical protein Ate01nite_62410 [Actinoplanes teichomyceticus]|nr:hypothetical protein Ate01nite_62410 [Actinoplanes teichomyceticus]
MRLEPLRRGDHRAVGPDALLQLFEKVDGADGLAQQRQLVLVKVVVAGDRIPETPAWLTEPDGREGFSLTVTLR